jgi:hypothetical protein
MIPLTQFERRWAHAAFGTIFPGADHGSLPLGIEDMELDRFIDQTLADSPFEPAIGLRLVFWVIGLAPLFVIGKLATIASLAPADRLRVVSVISASPVYALRSTVMMLKALGALLYCGDRRVRPHMIGVDPPAVALRAHRGPALPILGAENESHRRTA